jgi:hypothetical protein
MNMVILDISMILTTLTKIKLNSLRIDVDFFQEQELPNLRLLKHTDMTIKELTMFYQIKFEFKLTTPPG